MGGPRCCKNVRSSRRGARCQSNERPKASASEDEKPRYHVSNMSADTMYCHHLDAEGKHCVLNGIPSSQARHCCGVIYVKIGFSGKKMYCSYQRRPKNVTADAGHDACDADKCPFIAEGKECPYMALNCEACIPDDQSVPYIGYARSKYPKCP